MARVAEELAIPVRYCPAEAAEEVSGERKVAARFRRVVLAIQAPGFAEQVGVELVALVTAQMSAAPAEVEVDDSVDEPLDVVDIFQGPC